MMKLLGSNYDSENGSGYPKKSSWRGEWAQNILSMVFNVHNIPGWPKLLLIHFPYKKFSSHTVPYNFIRTENCMKHL